MARSEHSSRYPDLRAAKCSDQCKLAVEIQKMLKQDEDPTRPFDESVFQERLKEASKLSLHDRRILLNVLNTLLFNHEVDLLQKKHRDI